jgi:hypothetical protein
LRALLRQAAVAHVARTWLRSRWMPVLAALLGVLLALPALRIGFLLDDHYHRAVLRDSGPVQAAMNLFGFMRDSADVERLQRTGALPWWSHPELRIAFWRPLSSLTHWADDRLWRDDARLCHAHSLAWAMALTVAAGLAYRRFMGARAAAGLAAVLFAVDDAHYVPVAWIANRNALVSMLLGLCALILHDQWRRAGCRAAGLLAPLVFGLTLLGGESGVGMAAYLFAYALFLDSAPSLTRRMQSLAPCATVGMIWYACHASLGYGATGSGFYVNPMRDPLRFAAGAMWRWPALLQAQTGLISADLLPLLSRPWKHALFCASGVWVAGMTMLFLPLLRRCRVSRFFLTGAVLCLLPGFGTAPSDRLLLQCGFGFFGALALLTAHVNRDGAQSRRPVMSRRAMTVAVLMLLVVHGPLAALLLPERIGNLRLLNRLVGLEPERMPSRDQVAGRQLICPCPPSCFFFMYTGLLNEEHARSIRPLLLGLTSGTTPVRLTRLDARSVEVVPAGGFLTRPGEWVAGRGRPPHASLYYFLQTFDHLFRAPDHPMAVGERVRSAGCFVEVLRVASDGRPAAIRVEFPGDLDGHQYVWMTFCDSRYVPFQPPPVGKSVTVPPATFELPPLLANLGLAPMTD